MIPRRYEPVLFAALLSAFMSLLVSGIATLRAVGAVPEFMGLWMSAWITAWAIAFPIALVVMPVARRLVQRLVAPV